ncbi:MBL fold metallo-hydrolase [Desulfovibrio legallii]|jgi:glyoxylase-like metal-dependent hydrolase (beta-lactamase superfamily II)|uniref:Glyoxylase, beta-lactamase superfamily II n=1 Tax=Desulfovibrio legallii TaxID=571438 RepID=A0A1G7PH52_9BACT|nr:MBL fold metallo-hydrolase [Desulfovibrio legallii]SDF85601.1 Glyoxylase, beta-lactamase superfamily II [Desulfovibrio legallii]
MNLHVLYEGLPARLAQDYLSWPTCACVRSGGVNILFDTGFATQRQRLPQRLREAAGLAPEDIHIVVLSHLHYDHAYNFDLFPQARILAHTREIEHALHGAAGEFAYQNFLTQAIATSGRLEGVEEGYSPAPGVSVLFVPGHTPGCLALLLEDADAPPTVLAGDAVKNLAELATGRMPMVALPEEAAASIRKIRRRAAVVVPGHDRMLHVFPDRIEAAAGLPLTLVYAAGCVPPGHPDRVALGLPASALPVVP